MLGVLGQNAGGVLNLGVADDHLGAGKVDFRCQDQVQGRALQRVFFGRLVRLGVENRDRAGRGKHKAFVGGRIFKPHPAGAFDEDLAQRHGAVGIHLGEVGLHGGQPLEIGRQIAKRDLLRKGGGREREQGDRGEKGAQHGHARDIGHRAALCIPPCDQLAERCRRREGGLCRIGVGESPLGAQCCAQCASAQVRPVPASTVNGTLR